MAITERISYSKPPLADLICDQLTMDLHVHTRFSDSFTPIPRLMKYAADRGIGVAVTDHNEIRGAVQACARKTGPVVIPGMELTVHERPHMLIYFYSASDGLDFFKKHVEKNRGGNPYSITSVRMDDALDILEGYNALVGAAHPFVPSPAGLFKAIQRGWISEDVLKRLDFLEVISGFNSEKGNLRATKLALERSMAYTGGSDAHILSQVGSIVTYAEAETGEEMLDAIRKRKNAVVGRGMNSIGHISSAGAMLPRHMRYLDANITEKGKRVVVDGINYHIPQLKAKISTTTERIRQMHENGIEAISSMRRRGRHQIKKASSSFLKKQ
ncbi:MAG: PHP-associated domain-containing protein [archaeon]